MTGLRIGHGFDVHRLLAGRKLIIGGVAIPHDKGLDGHSDADVLLHAIADALLGAAGLPDIGHYFPPSDPKYKDADSGELLKRAWGLVVEAGFTSIVNIDSVVMAEAPRLLPHVPAMRGNVARILGVDQTQVGIKATTTEQLGFVGRSEGIAASAVCLISTE
ncbi:2-C-methyl-D-erythritol 2,4-cyclodiphosphate synthase [candidate division GN15 bacterium]|nr:2-C-methyl-D-erythritol 2,4-cyclodiphosphate synthase [candidate division GN15 bacterium]